MYVYILISAIIIIYLFFKDRIACIYNNISTDEYETDNFMIIDRAVIRKEDSETWEIQVDIDKLSTNTVKIYLNKGFCKKHNGEQLIVKLKSYGTFIADYGFVIDLKETTIHLEV